MQGLNRNKGRFLGEGVQQLKLISGQSIRMGWKDEWILIDGSLS